MTSFAASRRTDFVSLIALLPAADLTAGGGHAVAATTQDDAASCQAMAGRVVAPDTRIVAAEYAAQGKVVGDNKVDIAFCRIVGVATPTADSHIGFEVWLPPAT